MSAPTPFPEPSQDPYYQPPPHQGQQMMGPQLAGWWSRAGALVLDWLIALGFLIVPIIILAVIVVSADDSSSDGSGSPLGLLYYPLVFLFLFLYYPLTMKRAGQHNGQTWGMQALGIRVVREDGYQFTAGNAIVREILVKDLLMGICFIVQILNYLWPLWDDRNQCLHDKVCSTLVIRA
jgi:uncharacterized RDD family membrane protein YckC